MCAFLYIFTIGSVDNSYGWVCIVEEEAMFVVISAHFEDLRCVDVCMNTVCMNVC